MCELVCRFMTNVSVSVSVSKYRIVNEMHVQHAFFRPYLPLSAHPLHVRCFIGQVIFYVILNASATLYRSLIAHVVGSFVVVVNPHNTQTTNSRETTDMTSTDAHQLVASIWLTLRVIDRW